jgi:hypothetical protein
MAGADENVARPARSTVGSARAYGSAVLRSGFAFAGAGVRSLSAFVDAGVQTVAAFAAARRATRGASTDEPVGHDAEPDRTITSDGGSGIT